jgi:DNA topoisomerase-1
VKFGKVNATIPKSSSPETVTLEEAVALIAARAGAPAKKKPARKAAKKKPKAKAKAKVSE